MKLIKLAELVYESLNKDKSFNDLTANEKQKFISEVAVELSNINLKVKSKNKKLFDTVKENLPG